MESPTLHRLPWKSCISHHSHARQHTASTSPTTKKPHFTENQHNVREMYSRTPKLGLILQSSEGGVSGGGAGRRFELTKLPHTAKNRFLWPKQSRGAASSFGLWLLEWLPGLLLWLGPVTRKENNSLELKDEGLQGAGSKSELHLRFCSL